MSLAGTDNHRNVAAIAMLALFLSFSSFSLYNLTTRPVACFPGDIGSAKCPVSAGSGVLIGVQTGTGTCTIAAGVSNCNTVVSFSPAYGIAPAVTLSPITNGVNSILIPDDIQFASPNNLTAITWIMPLAITELFGQNTSRAVIATQGFTNYREMMDVYSVNTTGGAAPPNVRFNFQYASAGAFGPGCQNAASWTNMTEINVSTKGYKDTSNQAFPTVAKNNVCFRVIAYGGNGITASSYGRIQLRLLSLASIAFVCSESTPSASQFTLTIQIVLAEQISTNPSCEWESGTLT